MAEAVYSREQVEQWQEKLERIAELPRTTFTKRQVVEALIVSIEKALETRSYDEVAKALEADGLEISAGSLKQYVSKFRHSHKAAAGAAGRKRVARTKKDSSNGARATGTAKVAAKKGAARRDAPQVKAPQVEPTNRTPDGFLEMPEDL